MAPIRFNPSSPTTVAAPHQPFTAPPGAMDIPQSPSGLRRLSAPYSVSPRTCHQRGSHSSEDHPSSLHTVYSCSTSPAPTSSTLGTSLPASISPYSSRQARAWAVAEEKHARARASAFVPRRRSTADSLAHLSTTQLESTLHQRRAVLGGPTYNNLPSSAQRHMVHSVEQLERCLEERCIDDLTLRLAAQPGPSQSLPTYDASTTWNDTIDSFSLLSLSPSSYRRFETGCSSCDGPGGGTRRPMTIKPLPESDLAQVQAQVVRSEREEHDGRANAEYDPPTSSSDDEAGDWVFEQVLVQLEGD